ncbi:imm11 family protein [Myxococcus xanthus]|uniref:imm11 family protein n=1 Tax=Myxococcus xanthus TaxID=34 RepID=UPI001CECDE8E|nr:DUF1629 domain-containing protein [Myxococcus xanthus]UYI16416.1 hypothetical protein N3T43_08900 [Myxococcus xanthus]UYI23778.1 hypothetical protein N1129_08900 [Myxococcus xanthus]
MQTDYFMLMGDSLNQWTTREGPPPEKRLRGISWQQRPVFVAAPIKLRTSTGGLPKEPFPAYEGSCEPLLSAKAKSLLEPLAISHLQFLPADVSFESGEVKRLWWLHVYRSIHCVDRKRTKGLFASPRQMMAIGKLVLDEQALADIPLERRLIFRLGELLDIILLHSSLVERLRSWEAEGLKFMRVDEWHHADFIEDYRGP